MTTEVAVLQVAIRSSLRAAMDSAGFTESDSVYERPSQHPHIRVWVGIGMSTEPAENRVILTPTIGIRDERVTTILQHSLPSPAGAMQAHTVTAAMPLAALHADSDQFVCRACEDVPLLVGTLVTAITVFGLPEAERLAANPREVERHVREKGFQPEIQYPAVLVAHARSDLLHPYLTAQRARLREDFPPHDFYREYYEQLEQLATSQSLL